MVRGSTKGVVTYYAGRHYHQQVDGDTQQVKKFYYAGMQQIAVRTIVDEVDQGVQWILTDHLGSTSIVADEAGNLVSQVKYTAFGEIRAESGDVPTDYKYTGQLEQAEIGLYYYVARWYDPYITQMTQPDSIVPDVNRPLDYARYSYVRNNPIKYSDPTGHDACTDGTFHSFCPPSNFRDYDPKYYAYMYYADTHKTNTSNNLNMWEPSEAQASPELVKFILDWEKFETTLYDDGFGNCTVGFGHLIGGQCTQTASDNYQNKDFWFYYNLFLEDLHQAEAGVRRSFQDLDNQYYPGSSGYPLGERVPINQSQFDALVDFSYQMGGGNVRFLINEYLISSTDGSPFRDDDAFKIALTVDYSDASGIGVRRQQEVEIFFNGNYNSNH